ncbi:MAG: chemotaxis protein CheW [Actinomycetota bacterium]
MSVYVCLRVAAEAYAVPVGDVREVLEAVPVTAVPRALPEILGVRNLRGQILPVASLALILGRQVTAPSALLLVAESGGLQAGFAIDEVTGVGELSGPTGPAESPMLTGAVLAGGELVGFIDMARVFGSLARSP